MIVLRPVIGGRALEVVLYNPRKENLRVHRVWPWFWRVALASAAVCLWWAYLAGGFPS
jgi:hypothetical protein